MCGIAGVYSPQNLAGQVTEQVQSMVRALIHWGPDSEGFYTDSQVSMGMRRLSIIDVSGGQQPLYSPEKDLVLICNGEIYNFVELRKMLEQRGHRFYSHSDCETVLYLYKEYGVDFLKHLRGMFALALWDKTKNQLIIARDRFGERPFFYHVAPNGDFYFSSEMKSLLQAVPKERLTPDHESLNQFLNFQYIFEPKTVFKEIQKLPAGHFAILSPGQKFEPKAYWNYLDAPKTSTLFKSRSSLAEAVREKLNETVKIQLRSDVPVGVSLSGGIDSSIVAALVRKNTTQELKAYSVGYPGRPENDERQMAQRLAEQLNIEFHEIELSAQKFVDYFPQLVFDMDDPIGDIAAFGYYAVSKSARENNTTVLLSGLGADELFWGYQWVRNACRTAELKALISSKTPQFFEKLDWVPASAVLTNTLRKAPQESLHWNSFMNSENWSGDTVLKLLDLHNRSWLTSNCLALTDRLSMANSIETRLPFMDHELTDLVSGFRKGGMKDLYWGHKKLLIESCRDLLPEEIFDRPKRGFTPPVAQWMGWIVQKYLPLLKQGQLVQSGFLLPDVFEKVPPTEGLGLRYRLCILEIWLRVFYNQEKLASVSASVPAEVPL